MTGTVDHDETPVTEADVQAAVEDGINMTTTEVRGEENPEPNWNLEKLRTYVTTIGRRMAVDVWRLGRALMFARRQIEDRSAWKPWVAANCPGISYRTAMRYVKLATLYSTFEDIEKDGIRRAYIKAEIIKRAEGARAKPTKQGVAKSAARTIKPPVKTEPRATRKDEDARIIFPRLTHDDDDERPATINLPTKQESQTTQGHPSVACVVEAPPTAKSLALKAIAVAEGIENDPTLPTLLKPQLTVLRDILRELEKLTAA
jgi:hypothetical protein